MPLERSFCFTVVVATYNAAGTVCRLLRSLATQTYSDFEVIVCDGGSKDDTVSLCRSFENAFALTIIAERDRGIYDAWNKGVRASRGSWVMFLGADDWMSDDDVLSDLAKVIAGAPDRNLVSSLGDVVDPVSLRSLYRIGSKLSRDFFKFNNLCHPGLLHKRSLLSLGEFDLTWRTSADYAFLLEFNSQLHPIHVDRRTVFVSGGGVSRSDVWAVLRETLCIRLRYLSECSQLFVFWHHLIGCFKYLLRKTRGRAW